MNMSCYAWAEDMNGHRVVGPTITMEMADKEGWLNRSGSKWKTMPEVMIRYRAASFFGRLNCPDMIMGIYTTDEVVELEPDAYREVDPAEKVQQEIKEKANQVPTDIKVDKETGELIEPDADKGAKKPATVPQEVQKTKKDKPTPPPTDNKPAAGYDPGF